jgi:hypothetical protein
MKLNSESCVVAVQRYLTAAWLMEMTEGFRQTIANEHMKLLIKI